MACRNITLDPLSFKVFVETLDKCFENVCELDLIFHMDKVHFILNELVMGGMVLETNMNEILTRIEEQNKIEREEVRALTRILRVFRPSHLISLNYALISQNMRFHCFWSGCVNSVS